MMMKTSSFLMFWFILGNAHGVDSIVKCSNPAVIWNGEKGYYLGTFFKANWYKAQEFCHYHGMQLLSLSSSSELDYVSKIIQEFGIHPTWYWTSGSDLAEEGVFVWTSTGRPILKNSSLWTTNQPDNAGKNEHCVHLWELQNYKINDLPCATQSYFICETTACANLKYCNL